MCMERYYQPEIETASREQIQAWQDERLVKQAEMAVKEAQPWTVMCSYNKINGVYASENRWLLTEVLRDEWGFEGYAVSDWGAVSDRAAGVAAGLDLEMPASGGVNDRKIGL